MRLTERKWKSMTLRSLFEIVSHSLLTFNLKLTENIEIVFTKTKQCISLTDLNNWITIILHIEYQVSLLLFCAKVNPRYNINKRFLVDSVFTFTLFLTFNMTFIIWQRWVDFYIVLLFIRLCRFLLFSTIRLISK